MRLLEQVTTNLCVWHKIPMIFLSEQMNEYSTMNFLNSQLKVSSKGETSILKIEVCVGIHIIKIKWGEICSHLGFSLQPRKTYLQAAVCFIRICPHYLFLQLHAISEMKEYNDSKYTQRLPQIGFSENLPNQEQTERWNI